MGGLFSYDSKPMQILNFIADMIILNVLYIICCIPIVTIGAAQAGLHTGCKVLLDKEDDSSPMEAFFKGFIGGFWKVTAAWCIMTVIFLAVAYVAVLAYAYKLPLWIALLAPIICASFQALIPVFHARFDCSVWQLIKNPWFLLFAHPLRSLLFVGFLWTPVILLYYFGAYTVMSMAPVMLTLFYCTAFCMGAFFMKKPMGVLVKHFNETHGITEENPPAEEEVPELAE